MDLLDGLRDHPFVGAMTDEDYRSFFESVCSLAILPGYQLVTLPPDLQRCIGQIRDSVLGFRNALRDQKEQT